MFSRPVRMGSTVASCAVSPIRRIPVLIDDRVTLADSTVILEYLNERHPKPPLLPADLAQRATARWLEERFGRRVPGLLTKAGTFPAAKEMT